MILLKLTWQHSNRGCSLFIMSYPFGAQSKVNQFYYCPGVEKKKSACQAAVATCDRVRKRHLMELKKAEAAEARAKAAEEEAAKAKAAQVEASKAKAAQAQHGFVCYSLGWNVFLIICSLAKYMSPEALVESCFMISDYQIIRFFNLDMTKECDVETFLTAKGEIMKRLLKELDKLLCK